MATTDLIVHASCVAIHGDAVLITGPSGAGKSALALQLMAFGWQLVADDRTCLHREGAKLLASSPKAISGLIEARGVGLLPILPLVQAPVVLVVDMSVVETERLPQRRLATLLDITLTCLHKVDAPYFPAAIHTYVMGIRNEAQ